MLIPARIGRCLKTALAATRFLILCARHPGRHSLTVAFNTRYHRCGRKRGSHTNSRADTHTPRGHTFTQRCAHARLHAQPARPAPEGARPHGPSRTQPTERHLGSTATRVPGLSPPGSDDRRFGVKPQALLLKADRCRQATGQFLRLQSFPWGSNRHATTSDRPRERGWQGGATGLGIPNCCLAARRVPSLALARGR